MKRVGIITTALAALAISGGTAYAAPGSPGTPGPPSTVFTEDFENGLTAPGTAIFLNDYTGAGPLNMTYTAHPAWINGPACNGLIGALNTSVGSTGCSQSTYNTFVGPLAAAVGATFGGGNANHVVAYATATGATGAPVNAATLETVNPVPLPSADRFITFSVDVGVTACAFPADPLLRFFLLDGSTAIPTNAMDINPCTDPRSSATFPGGSGGIRVGRYPADTGILFGGTSVGVRLANAQTGGSGNDYSIDNVRILDATPQLDKTFVSDVQAGQPARLLLTVTNTSDLASKDGWSFTDNLPSGLRIAATPNVAVSCENSAGTATPPTGADPVNVTAVGGETSISVAGDLKSGDAFCEVAVDVEQTGGLPGTFANGPSNISSRIGLDPPGTASVTFVPPPVSRAAVVAESTKWTLGDALPGSPLPTFLYGTRPLTPMMGDWNGDGLKTVGTFESGTFRLNNQNDNSAADITFTFGDPRAYAVAGDYDGNGFDDVALYKTGTWQVRYLGPGARTDQTFRLAAPFGQGDWPATVPVAGDWDGDGIDGIGTVTPSTASWVLKNTVGAGGPDIGPFTFGPAGAYPVVGDWGGNGFDTPGYRVGTTWTVRTAAVTGGATSTFNFGVANSVPFSW